MKRIDVLLEAARKAAAEMLFSEYMQDDGNFIKALDLDPDLYAVALPDGQKGYDFMRALNDSAAADWDPSDLESEPEEEKETYKRESEPVYVNDSFPDAITLEVARKMLHCFAKREVMEVLEQKPVIIDGEPRFITIEELRNMESAPAERPTKIRNLFGWG